MAWLPTSLSLDTARISSDKGALIDEARNLYGADLVKLLETKLTVQHEDTSNIEFVGNGN